MKVLKFGGTSMGSVMSIRSVCKIINDTPGELCVVVSAPSGMTDRLLRLASEPALANPAVGEEGCLDRYIEMFDEMTARSPRATLSLLSWLGPLARALRMEVTDEESRKLREDAIVAQGERFSTRLLTMLLSDTVRVPASRLIHTRNDRRTLDHSQTLAGAAKAVKAVRNRVRVMEGFIARDPQGRLANLGRGGSDYTAAIMAKAVGAERLEIWTDVDGYMTADPRKDTSARLIPRMTQKEALKMSLEGAKVVYAPAMEILQGTSIPVHVRNTFRPDAEHTVIEG
ncbi:MAG: aspartate kinase [Candidatus Amulumruptor caecigallinarius]|nr:aspartate kinase [Candidatus Amulumruptor caecigallinarius]MCM1396238.1 aspartate kinase [Candidatus Amulumruptor caecigallinarius]MCM1453762.1 aspartate kinase [bacterium]